MGVASISPIPGVWAHSIVPSLQYRGVRFFHHTMVEVLFGLARLGQKRWRNPFRCRRLDRMVLLLLLLPSLYACRILLMLLSPLFCTCSNCCCCCIMSFLCFLVCPPCGKAMPGRRACAPGGYDDPGGNDPMAYMSWPCIAPSTFAATRFPFLAPVPGCEAPGVCTDSPWGTGSSWSISDSVGAGLVGGCCSALSSRASDSFGSCGGMRSAI